MVRLGMADVLVRTLAVLVGVYGVAVVGGFAASSRGPDPLTGGVLVVAALWLAVSQHRAVAGVMAVVAFVAANGPAASTMTVAVGWAATAVALFTGSERAQALRWFACVVYLFAAANKITSPRFRSGEVIDGLVSWVPAPRVVAWSVIAAEVAVAVLVWRRSRYALAGVIALHAPLVIFAPESIGGTVTLATYAALMGWVVSGSLREEHAYEPDVARERVRGVVGKPAHA